MFRLAKWLPCVAVLAGAVLLGMASPAHATIELTLTQVGGPTTSVTSPSDQGPVIIGTVNAGLPPTITPTTFGDFTIALASGSSNSPGSSLNAQTAGVLSNFGLTPFSIVNNSATEQSLIITISAQNFSSPNSPPPLDVFDTVSGTVSGGSVTGTAQGFADASNTLYGDGNSSLPGGFAGALLTFAGTNGTLSGSISQSGIVSGFSPNGATYSLTFTETITLTAGASLTLTGGNVQTLPTPEPASMMAAFTAVPFLGLGAWLRRRKQAI